MTYGGLFEERRGITNAWIQSTHKNSEL